MTPIAARSSATAPTEAEKQPLPKSELEHGRPPVQKGHHESSTGASSGPQSEASGVNRALAGACPLQFLRVEHSHEYAPRPIRPLPQ
jgi:hypothetical protein